MVNETGLPSSAIYNTKETFEVRPLFDRETINDKN